MRISDMAEPIVIEESTCDSRDLTIPHQKNAVEAMSKYFDLDKDIKDRNGLVVIDLLKE